MSTGLFKSQGYCPLTRHLHCRWAWMGASTCSLSSHQVHCFADTEMLSFHYKLLACQWVRIVSSSSKRRLLRLREAEQSVRTRVAAQSRLAPLSVNFFLKYYFHVVFIWKHGISPAGESEWIFKRNLSTYLGLAFRPEFIIRSKSLLWDKISLIS